MGTKFTLSALRKATLTSKFISFVPLRLNPIAQEFES